MAWKSSFFISYRWLLLVKVVCLICFAYYVPTIFTPISTTRSSHSLVSERTTLSKEPRPGYVVDASNCKIVDMDPWHPSVRKFFKDKKIKSCPRDLISRIKSNLVYDKAHPNFNTSSCCFREIHRISQSSKNYNMVADWQIRFSPNCTGISSASTGTTLTSEFTEIQCKSKMKGKLVNSKQYIATVFPPEKHTNKTKAKVQHWHFESTETNREETKTSPAISPSVLILGIDSVSRMHMYRSLQNTKKFLEANDFVEMKGYTKIGENTFPNMMGILGGMENHKYPCWKKMADKIDDCPLIWKNFSHSNYITALLEDSAGLGNFNFLKAGFVEQPTDYYLRPVTIAYHGRLRRTQSYRGCVGGMTQTNFMIEYLRNFVTAMGQVPYFLLSWFTTVGHDDINDLKPMDLTFRQLLSDLVDDESYNGNNTIILFISDHGYRFGGIRETFLGYYEESLPFFYLRLPPALKLSHPHWYENLRMNSHRLTSPLDFHATLEDILSLSFPSSSEKPFAFTHSNWESTPRKVYSFFEETPLNRTCESSGIPQLYCRCGVTPAVGKKSKNSVKFGELVIKTVNNILLEAILNDTCIPLKFSKFLYLRELSEGEVWDNFGKLITFKDHLVALEASPSNAHFEAKVRLFKNDTMTIIGEVSRINSYQGQNDCLKDYTLKNYCMCRDYFTLLNQRKLVKEKNQTKISKNNKKATATTAKMELRIENRGLNIFTTSKSLLMHGVKKS